MNQSELLKSAKDALDRAIAEKKMNQEVIKSLGPAVIDTLRPILQQIADNSKLSQKDLLDTLSKIKITVPKADVPKAQVDVNIPEIKVPEPKVIVNVPEIKLPDIKIPEIKVPKIPKPEITVKIPKIEIPELEWPKGKMPIEGWVKLMGIDLNNPLPVQLRNPDGTLMRFPEPTSGGGGGGRGVVQTRKPQNIHIDNVAMLAANTEYSHALPSNTVAMTIQNRENNDMRVSYVIGRVATSTAAFMIIKGGQAYYETNVDLSGKTLYFASERTGTVEIISYD